MESTKRFEEFQKNVIGWAEDKGIYAFSTPLAQALKAVSEAGELADASIKGDIDGIKDAIGDVAVCLVNFGKMVDVEFLPMHNCNFQPCPKSHYLSKPQGSAAYVSSMVADIANLTAKNRVNNYWGGVMQPLIFAAMANNLDFLDCCESAWLEIKDRKGRMVEGGAFVKDE